MVQGYSVWLKTNEVRVEGYLHIAAGGRWAGELVGLEHTGSMRNFLFFLKPGEDTYWFFKKWLLSMPGADVINNAFEYVQYQMRKQKKKC